MLEFLPLNPQVHGEKEVLSEVRLSAIFSNHAYFYINAKMLFTEFYRQVPNIIEEYGIDCKKASNWVIQHYGHEIKDYYFYSNPHNQRIKLAVDDIYYLLFNDVIIHFGVVEGVFRILFKNTDLTTINDLTKRLSKFRKRKTAERPTMSLIVAGSQGLETKLMDLKPFKSDLEKNYNDDFLPVHKRIYQVLSKKQEKGLVLLHGKPGTGKTSYIRYLISKLKKPVIFLPSDMAKTITHPGFIGLVIDNPNSILVIEDAENLILDRTREKESPVSALLNVCDGLLSDCLNIQVICSFNTDLSKIDSALLRKGRLIARYEFKELDIDKAQALANSLGFNALITAPMPLSSVYNLNEPDYERLPANKAIGFSVAYK